MLRQARQAFQRKVAQIGQKQRTGWNSGDGLTGLAIVDTSIMQRELRQQAGGEVQAQIDFQRRVALVTPVATALPDGLQGLGQHNGRAIFDIHAFKASQQRNGERIGRPHAPDRLGQDRMNEC